MTSNLFSFLDAHRAVDKRGYADCCNVIKEDLISDSWRNKESSCQNSFLLPDEQPLAIGIPIILSHLCHSFKKNPTGA